MTLTKTLSWHSVKTLNLVILASTIMIGLTACGQKGGLYLAETSSTVSPSDKTARDKFILANTSASQSNQTNHALSQTTNQTINQTINQSINQKASLSEEDKHIKTEIDNMLANPQDY